MLADEGLGAVTEMGVAVDFEQFYAETSHRSLTLARAVTGSWSDAEDLVQEAYAAAHRRWHIVGHYDDPSSWVRRVILNSSVSRWRRLGRELAAVTRLAGRGSPVVADTAVPDDEFWCAVRRLPAQQMRVVALRYVADLTVQQIADELGCTAPTVKTHLARAFATLRTILTREEASTMDIDVIDPELDARARHAASDLSRVAATRPLRDRPRRRHRPVRHTIAAVVVAILVLTGLVWTTTRQGRSTVPGDDQPRLEWIIADLPAGMTAVGRAPTEADETAGFLRRVSVYATDAAPDGPIIMISGMFGISPGLRELTESTSNGHTIVLGTDSNGVRSAWVQLDGDWWSVASAHVDDATLTRIAARLTAKPDGTAAPDPATLPNTLRFVGTGTARSLAPSVNGIFRWATIDPDIVAVDYSTTTTGLGLTIGASTTADLAVLRLSAQLQPTTIDGAPGWVVTGSSGPTAIVWQRNGLLLTLSSVSIPADQLAQIATSVRPATQQEWNALPRLAATSGDRAVDGTSPADTGDASAQTTPAPPPPSVATIRDIDLQVQSTAETDNETVLAGELPDGTRFDIDVAVIAQIVRVAPHDDTYANGLSTYDLTTSPTDPSWQPIATQHGQGVAVATTRTDVTKLRVLRTNGDRYTMPLVTVAGRPETRFAAILFPENQLAAADLIDDKGNVISSLKR